MPTHTRAPLTVHVVTHTHWDREWYHTAEEFRPGLVELVDEVLRGAAGEHFLLDGQAVVLLDYLRVRPEQEGVLALALREGRVEAGPWFVLGDNLIPSGEALVRNLLAGRQVLERFGADAPRVLYCPDAFGHPAALPTLAAEFGCPVAIVWRGYGGPPWPPGDSARWTSADGSEVVLHHLPPDGYEVGSHLPVDEAEARARWERLRAVLERRAVLDLALLPNGADHHAVQRELPRALAALAQAAEPARIAAGSLGAFARALVARAAARRLPAVQGELRYSPDYAWSLQGTFGSRAWQKRAYAAAERLLVHLVEPMTALATWRGARSHSDERRELWRTLLLCHPHDTLCGCSIDEVAAAMDRRLDEVQHGGREALRRARLQVLGHDAAASRDEMAAWHPVASIWNPLPRPRAGICELDLDEVIGVVPVGPGSAAAEFPRRRRGAARLRLGASWEQDVAHEVLHAREESPRHYPHNTLIHRRRVLVWVPPVPACGALTLAFARGGRTGELCAGDGTRVAAVAVPSPVRTTPDALDNTLVRAWVDPHHGLCFTTADGLTLHDVLGIEGEGERGDLYTHSPIPGTKARGAIVRHRVTRRGPLRGELRLTMRVVVPPRALTSATGIPIVHRATPVTLTVDVQLDAGSTLLRLVVHGQGVLHDVRVRVLVRSGLSTPEVWADAAFGEVPRVLASTEVKAMGRAGELPPNTAPLHRYVSLYGDGRGMTVLADGLAEYEATSAGDVAVTLVRAVGELSRRDLPERPGHAGWPVATPAAQGRGPIAARLALLPHTSRSDETLARVNEAAEEFLLPLVGETWQSAIRPPAKVEGPRLTGDGLGRAACKESEDGESLVLRCVNCLGRVVAGAWHLAGMRDARLARLDESPLGVLVVRDEAVEFEAPPFATVTILARRH